MELDRIPVRILELDLLPARADLDRVPETPPVELARRGVATAKEGHVVERS